MEGTQQPRRMRFSWESRCRIVVLIESGMSPQSSVPASSGVHSGCSASHHQRPVRSSCTRGMLRRSKPACPHAQEDRQILVLRLLRRE